MGILEFAGSQAEMFPSGGLDGYKSLPPDQQRLEVIFPWLLPLVKYFTGEAKTVKMSTKFISRDMAHKWDNTTHRNCLFS